MRSTAQSILVTIFVSLLFPLQPSRAQTSAGAVDAGTSGAVVRVSPEITSSELNAILADQTRSAKTIFFPAGTYHLGKIRLKQNTRIVLDDDAVIKVDGKYLFFNFELTDTHVLGYAGQGNISVEGGTIHGHAASFIHASDVSFRNIKFRNSLNDHYFEIAACRNFKIENCHFRGMAAQREKRGYVEYVQLDNPARIGFPHLGKADSPTFDGTPNTNIAIVGCSFDKGDTEPFDNLYAGIGSHGRGARYQTHISIVSNRFAHCSYAGISPRGWRHVVIEDNVFEQCSSALLLKFGNNDVVFRNNQVSHADNGVYALNDNNSTFRFLKIDDNRFDHCAHRLNVDIIPQEGIEPIAHGGLIFDTNNRIEDCGTDIVRCKRFYYACGNAYVRPTAASGPVVLLHRTADCTLVNNRFSQIALKGGDVPFHVARIENGHGALMIANNESDSVPFHGAMLGNGDLVKADGQAQLIANRDLDTCLDTRNHQGENCTNTPPEVGSGKFTLQVFSEENRLFQVVISTSSNAMFMRTRHETWGGWAKIEKSSDVEALSALATSR